MISQGDSAAFGPDLSRRRILHRRVLRWYARHRRALPWRDIDDPYCVMVSEFMLQQTQVARVLDHFTRWIERFPDIGALARASRRDVLLAWSGMGYNRRALQLHAAAREIAARYDEVVPADPALLRLLPGFGRYTAHAVACFGYRQRLPLVEVNIRRLLSRLHENMREERALLPETDIWRIADALLPPRAFYDWNQALMDFGASVCTARAPVCGSCPLRTDCPSAGMLRPAAREARVGSAAAVREVPRRIYRGRVVEFLREANGHCADAARLHEFLFDIRGDEERARLLDILATLQRDGMLRVLRGADEADIRSFQGPLSKLHLCLAE